MRADAVANRTRILAVAAAAFAERGLDVSLDEVASLAGVGPGTLHRNFPTKALLVDAAIAEGVVALARTAEDHARAADPVDALFSLLNVLVARGAESHALAARLGRTGVDVGATVATPLRELRAALATLFHRARRAGGLRRGLTVGDLEALLAGAYTLHTHANGGPHLVALLFDSMRGDDRRRSWPFVGLAQRRRQRVDRGAMSSAWRRRSSARSSKSSPSARSSRFR